MVRAAFLVLAGFGASALAQTAPVLKSAASFAVLGGSAVESSGKTTITGNLGVNAGASITGSPTVILGKTYRNDAIARQAQKDAAAAYADLAKPCAVTLTEDLGGKTLPPGVYCYRSSAQLTGNLTLDGNAGAVWIFRIPGDLTTSAGSAVSVINGGSTGNVFWQIGGSATLGERTVFTGSVLALANITLGNGASVSGRLLARTGVVTLGANDVSVCCKPITVLPPTLPSGTVGTSYSVTFRAMGGLAPYTFNVLSGTLPSGLALPSSGVLSGRPADTGNFHFTVAATDAHGCSDIREYEIAVCPITVLPETLPNGTVGALYDETITAKGGKGPPYTFSVTEGLPPELGLDPKTGILSGPPATPGRYTFTVTASDGVCSGSRTYTIVICGLAITTPTLPNGRVGTIYSEVIKTTGGVGALTFSAPAPALPPGLKLDQEKGILFGTPTADACFTFTVTVTDSLGCSASRTYTICISCPVISLSDLPGEGTVATPYNNGTITASGGAAPYRFAVTAGALPRGLILHPDSGVVDMTPTLPGRFVFTVTATDANGCTGNREYVIVVDCPEVILSPATLPPATFGEFYCQTLTASGAIGPYEFFVTAGNLPTWLNLSRDGALYGVPSVMASSAVTPSMPVPGTTFTVTAIDTISGCTGEETYAILVLVCSPSIVVSPPGLPGGMVGIPYSQVISASDGIGPYPYTFAKTCGTLPAGLRLMRPNVGALVPTVTLFGIPSDAGTYVFTVTATGAKSCSTALIYTVVIAPED